MAPLWASQGQEGLEVGGTRCWEPGIVTLLSQLTLAGDISYGGDIEFLHKSMHFQVNLLQQTPPTSQPQVLLLVASYPLTTEVPQPQQATFSGGFVLDAWA